MWNWQSSYYQITITIVFTILPLSTCEWWVSYSKTWSEKTSERLTNRKRKWDGKWKEIGRKVDQQQRTDVIYIYVSELDIVGNFPFYWRLNNALVAQSSCGSQFRMRKRISAFLYAAVQLRCGI